MGKGRRVDAHLDERELERIARRAGCPMRYSGGHLVIKLPNGKTAVVRAPGRPNPNNSRCTPQVKMFREAGLIP